MISTLKKLILISRPISWPNTAYPFAAGYLLTKGVDLTLLVGTLYFLIPYNLLMYGINDVFDYESDIRNPRKGGIEGMREQRAFHPVIIYSSILINVPLIAWFLIQGTLLSTTVLAIVIFMVIAYSAPILRFKEKPFLDSVTSSSHFVGPLLFALSLTGSINEARYYLTAFFLWGMASHAFGAVQDIIPDRKANISSVATFVGASVTVKFSFALYVVAALILLASGNLGIIVGLIDLLYAVNIWRYFNVTDEDSGITNLAWRRFIWLNYLSGFLITILLILVNA